VPPVGRAGAGSQAAGKGDDPFHRALAGGEGRGGKGRGGDRTGRARDALSAREDLTRPGGSGEAVEEMCDACPVGSRLWAGIIL